MLKVCKYKPKALHWERVDEGSTPSQDQIACCLRKTRFTKAEAYMEIRKQIVMHTIRLYAYRCPYCLGYHLTSKPNYDGHGDPSKVRPLKF